MQFSLSSQLAQEQLTKLSAKHTTEHAKHGAARGVWGHAPPGNFEKLALPRLHLVHFLTI